MSAKLGKTFYEQSTLTLARRLLGKRLHRFWRGRELVGRIVEVEAYHQDGDRASHSFNGPSRRNGVMFGPAGFLYVYFIYGKHYCMNVVTETQGIGAAVLIRALEPETGLTVMTDLRGGKIKRRDLTNGPAKCCRALGVSADENGLDLCGNTVFLSEATVLPASEIGSSGRIGISKSKDLVWRFFVKNNAYVSRAKP